MLNNVIGQERGKEILKLITHGYQRRKTMPAIGIFGGTGLGKTHLVSSWTEEIGAQEIYINGTAVKDALAFRAFFKAARENQSNYYIIFVDESHGLPQKVQDNLLSVLEKPSVLCTTATKDMGVIRCVDGARVIEKGDLMREELPTNMSFVLATTHPAQLKDPILNRLRKIYLAPYTIDEKIQIAMMHLGRNEIGSNLIMCEALAMRSRSIRHLKDELCDTLIDIYGLYGEDALKNLSVLDDLLGIDEDGATDADRDYLTYLAENTVVSLSTLEGKLRIEKKELLANVEPYLLDKGWITITGRGRRLTKDGYKKVFGDDYELPTE